MRRMKQINPADRRALRARAHALHPVVIVSSAGLADSVVAEIERCLKAHELIKIRVFSDDRPQREELLAQICERTGASPVQHIGKILVVYRRQPEPPKPKRPPPKRPPAPGSTAKAALRGKPGSSRRGEAPLPRGRGQTSRRPSPQTPSRPASHRKP